MASQFRIAPFKHKVELDAGYEEKLWKARLLSELPLLLPAAQA
jgi:hypothetical protein